MKNLLILIGPSAGGKTTLAQYLQQNDFNEIVSITTRQPRHNEVPGKSYFFWSVDRFTECINSGDMLEYAEYGGNFYGNEKALLRSQIDENYSKSKNSVIITELEGAINLKKWVWQHTDDVKCLTAFCYVPPEEQKRRLIERTLQDLGGAPYDVRIKHLSTFFERAKNSETEYDWMKHKTVDLLLVCDEGSEQHNLAKISRMF
jgi:guanylate kinase